MASRAEQKKQLREQRQRSEQEGRRADARKKKAMILAITVLVAAIAVLVLIAISQKWLGSDKGVEAVRGVPQSGTVLGKPKAAVKVVEFADLQCPVCRSYMEQSLPDIVKQYVKTGKAKVELKLLAVLGADSVTAAKAAMAAEKQNLEWDYSEVFYQNQGSENSGYVTEDFLKEIAGKVPGLDVKKWEADLSDPSLEQQLEKNTAAAKKAAIKGTPTFEFSGTNGDTTSLSGPITPQQFGDGIAKVTLLQ